MRIAVLSDAHANHLGLESCLEWLSKHESIDQLYFLGDAVGYFSEPNRVIKTLCDCGAKCLLGNHDAMVLGNLDADKKKAKVYHVQETRDALTDENAAVLSSLQPKLEEEIGSRRVLFVHGSPFDPLEEYIYPDADLQRFESIPYDAVFMGHTHRPFCKSVGDKLIVNVGSCGQPRDHGSLASFAVYDTEDNHVEILRLKMDVPRIIEHFSSAVDASVLKTLERKPESFVGRIVGDG